MSTYLINHLRIPGGIPNDASLTYLEQVEATAKPYGATWLAQGAPDVIEGAWPDAVVLMVFPDRVSAEAWYNSAEYQSILPLRVNNSISDLVFIDSLPEGFTVAGFAQQTRAAIAGS